MFSIQSFYLVILQFFNMFLIFLNKFLMYMFAFQKTADKITNFLLLNLVPLFVKNLLLIRAIIIYGLSNIKCSWKIWNIKSRIQFRYLLAGIFAISSIVTSSSYTTLDLPSISFFFYLISEILFFFAKKYDPAKGYYNTLFMIRYENEKPNFKNVDIVHIEEFF